MPPAVVTGAASGIGRALATALAAEGRTVYAADISPIEGIPAGSRIRALAADVSDPAQMERLAETASDARLVCLNAGITGETMGAPWEAPMDEWERVLHVNLLGVVNGLRAFVPRLLATGEPAHVLITASLAGLVTFPTGGAYAATKHAVVAVAEQTALTLAGSDIGVTVLCPALVRSGMSPEGDDPADVAAEALAACRRGIFTVVPAEWRGAVVQRGTDLATGALPQMPAATPISP